MIKKLVVRHAGDVKKENVIINSEDTTKNDMLFIDHNISIQYIYTGYADEVEVVLNPTTDKIEAIQEGNHITLRKKQK